MTMLELMAALMAGSVLAALPSLSAVYVVCLIVAGGFLVLSIVLGSDADADAGDLDVDAGDLDADTGGGHGGAVSSGMSLATWFSIHFVVYFLAVFGLVGTVLSYMTKTGNAAILIWAFALGLVIGQSAHQLLRYLRRTSSDSSVRPADYVNKIARVTVDIEPPNVGEVAVQVQDAERFLPAVAKRDRDKFEAGSRVVVVGLNAGTAVVVSRQEYEFMTDSKPGGTNE
jgi:membrane protein implicated in regulation of membrane protease activity